ncbi:MAG: cobalt-precorrin-5B (C(1))-methyltransferase CbiD, partial [Clostridium sp.]
MEVLRCENLCFKYEDKMILNSINLAISKGEIIGILGGNGAGKSTLFLNLNGILKRDSGDVFLNGERLDKGSSKTLRNNVGIVFQNPDEQIISSSVFDDISFGLINQGLCEDEIRKRVNQIIKEFSLENIVDIPIHNLSYGQRKKVAIAGVVVMKPQVIILDEPTAGLDPSGVSEMKTILKSLVSDYGASVIISTHEMDLVPNLCSRIYVLNNGEISFSGNVEDALNNPSVLRSAGLRLPRLSHLMEVLRNKDGIEVDITSSTISKVRSEIKRLAIGKACMSSVKGGKELRCGYTTGSCSAAASKASTLMLLTRKKIEMVQIETPKGIPLHLKVEDQVITDSYASCSIVKDGGDDPDVTTGLKVYSTASYSKDSGIHIDGGKGVGRVTKGGLAIPIGQAAINPVPRKMIEYEVKALLEEEEATRGINIVISVKGGEETALRTFNPRLGIEGGISILGTTGIVEPMSDDAIIESFKAEMRMHKSLGYKTLVIAPGNYGQVFSRENYNLSDERVIKVGNFIGEALDYGNYLGFDGIVLIGHMGKMVKLAGGIMNTHSKVGDCRGELLSLYTLLEGGTIEDGEKILTSTTTDEAYE